MGGRRKHSVRGQALGVDVSGNVEAMDKNRQAFPCCRKLMFMPARRNIGLDGNSTMSCWWGAQRAAAAEGPSLPAAAPCGPAMTRSCAYFQSPACINDSRAHDDSLAPAPSSTA